MALEQVPLFPILMVPLFHPLADRTMATRSRNEALLTLPLDAAEGKPLFRQLYEGLRQSILDGRLKPGVRLPATRSLAGELGVSRNTVLNAYKNRFRPHAPV
jgi:hypothetical protein